MTLVLVDDQVRQLLDMEGAIAAMESLCREEAAGGTFSADRVHLRHPRGFLRILPGVLSDTGVMGYKAFHVSPGGVRYAIHLFDYESGAPLAMLDASYITAIRTGAMGGVALKHLAPPHAKSVAVIGSGAEARSQMEALMAVRPEIREGRVYSPRAERRVRFARDVSQTYGVHMDAMADPREATSDAEVILVATGTRGTVAFEGSWLQAGVHINSIGSTAPEQREIDPDVWRRADRVAVDTRRLLHESGDALAADQAGALDGRAIVELHEIVGSSLNESTPRARDEVTLYKSVGTGLQDVAAAAHVYRAACEQGVGSEITDFLTSRRPADR